MYVCKFVYKLLLQLLLEATIRIDSVVVLFSRWMTL